MAKLAPKWQGPAKVMKQHKFMNYKVAMLKAPDKHVMAW